MDIARFKAHLSLEDTILYPRVGRNRDAHAARTAQRYQDEMGSIASNFIENLEFYPAVERL